MRSDPPVKMNGGRAPEVVEQPNDVLPGGDAGYWPGQDVVEHQRRDADLGKGAAQRLLDDAVDAPTSEHRAALDVNGAYGIGEEDNPEDQPRSSFADSFFCEACGVESRGA